MFVHPKVFVEAKHQKQRSLPTSLLVYRKVANVVLGVLARLPILDAAIPFGNGFPLVMHNFRPMIELQLSLGIAFNAC
jgi:hypothetical protein